MRTILVIIGLVIALAIAIPLSNSIADWNSYQNDKRAQELDRQRWQDELERQRLEAIQPGVIASDYGWRLLTFFSAIGLLMVLQSAYATRQRRVELDRRLVYPDQSGRLPVARAALEERAIESAVLRTLEMWHVGEIEQKRTPLPPVTYAPHLTYHNESTSPAAAAAAQLAAPASVPTFSALLSRGRVGKGNPLLLGFEAGGQELTGSWLDLYSTIVAGMSGTGKTTSQRSLACQTALHGAKFAIADPHAGAADDSLAATLAPLSACFAAEPASSDKAILDLVRYVADVGRRRVDGKDKDTTPLILWIDELTSLLGRSTVAEPLAELLERVAQEYRKRFVFVCGSGQIFTAARTTSELRDSFASAIVHRMRRNQARLLLPTDEAAQVERLETGHAVLWRTSGATMTIAIPNTTASDVLRVAGLLTSDAASMPSVRSGLEVGTEVGVEVGTYSLPDALNLKAARVREMLREKRSQNEIIATIWNATGGIPYQRASDEYRTILADLVSRA